MKFLPTENITYRTKLKEGEIVQRLSDIIEPERTFRFGRFSRGSSKAYEGRLDDRTFSIKRIISYRNSFRPGISGAIKRDFDGCSIEVKMRLPVFAMVFLCVWCGGIGFGGIVFLTQAFTSTEFHAAAFIPFGMLLFAYALTLGAFKYESNKSKKDLKALFEAHAVEDSIVTQK